MTHYTEHTRVRAESPAAAAPVSVAAMFVRQASLRVSVERARGGTVVSRPAGIGCASTCAATFDRGTFVRLRAAPLPTWRFVGWQGACRGQGVCSIRLGADTHVAAVFRRR
jgi:hypothetical protein